jgi:GTP-binding protein
VKSAAAADDLPREGVPELAMVGRSNVGKSSLINALVRQKVARTSAAPGKTRLANIYRVARGSSRPFYLVDLPGYGYARGGASSAREFEELARAYFAPSGQMGRVRGGEPSSTRHGVQDRPGPAVLLLVDARHPGLESDVDAWTWMRQAVGASALVATKIDKLSRGERSRALRQLQSVFEDPVLPVSAVTGEGLDELWKLIDNLTNPNQRPRSRGPAAPPPLQKSPPPSDLRRSPQKR